MIQKEHYMTRKDGTELYRTYSDTEHIIRSKATGQEYSEAVDIGDDNEYEETDGYVVMDGPETYEEVLAVQESMRNEAELTARKINRIGLTDAEAISVRELYPHWEDKVGKTIEAGYVTLYAGSLWRARQTHTAMDIYPPGMDTASLYEVLVVDHAGTAEDPIPYMPPMEITAGLYYTQNDVLYLCTADSGTALTHDLEALVGIYVEVA